MLLRLCIQNIALIDNVELDFGEGLNVLSGETGAGKSIIVDALGLVCGEKSKRMLVGGQGESARVEGVFDVSSNEPVRRLMSELGIEDSEGMLILSRELNKNGRSICKVNAQMVTLSVLKQLGDVLVDIHGQHEHQALFDPRSQLFMLDRFGGREIMDAGTAAAQSYHRYKELHKQLRTRFGDEGEREKRLDFLRFQTDEIRAASLKEDEEEKLIALRKRMQNARRIMDTLSEAYDLLCEDADGRRAVLGTVDHAAELFNQIRGLDDGYAQLAEKLQSAYYTLEEIAYDVRDLRASFEFDPMALEEAQVRLDQIARLKRKYGPTVRDVLVFYETARRELDELENSAGLREKLAKECAQIEKTLLAQCRTLHEARKSAALRLAALVREQLSELGFKKAQFEIAFQPPPEDLESGGSRLSAGGFDAIEFMISPNPGQALMPLARIVSGGEASRIMLALKTIVADLDAIGTLVFDEIDTGLSGRMAHVVARKLGVIAKGRQVLCITHLSQIAAMADIHFLIEKTDDAKKTAVSVLRLDKDGEINEIARLSGAGSDMAAALAHARLMKIEADAFKQGGR
ncbi:MAG: DNA repair protein RecN [Bacillota bacterium]